MSLLIFYKQVILDNDLHVLFVYTCSSSLIIVSWIIYLSISELKEKSIYIKDSKDTGVYTYHNSILIAVILFLKTIWLYFL